MKHDVYIYIAIMAIATYAIRTLPQLVLQRPIHNRFMRSFLYYVPYVALAVMTFPAIISTTQTPLAGAAALAVGIIFSWMGAGLIPVSLSCCLTVFIVEAILI